MVGSTARPDSGGGIYRQGGCEAHEAGVALSSLQLPVEALAVLRKRSPLLKGINDDTVIPVRDAAFRSWLAVAADVATGRSCPGRVDLGTVAQALQVRSTSSILPADRHVHANISP